MEEALECVKDRFVIMGEMSDLQDKKRECEKQIVEHLIRLKAFDLFTPNWRLLLKMAEERWR